MASCQDISQLMSLALDQSLTQGEVRCLEEHLEECPTCQEEWEAMQRISRLLTGVPLMGPPPGFAGRVMQRLARREARRRRFLAGVALLVACLGLGAFALPEIIGLLAMLWQVVSQPSLLGYGAKLVAQLLGLGESLGRACWLVTAAFFSSFNQLALLGYSFLVLALIALWIRLMAGRRGVYRPVINNV
jgi:predicted anti-sigma-YlaC factor YlaD